MRGYKQSHLFSGCGFFPLEIFKENYYKPNVIHSIKPQISSLINH